MNNPILDLTISIKVWRYCNKDKESDEVDANSAVIEAPEPVQPVMQPATNIFINNTGYQPAPTQQQVCFNKFLESRTWHFKFSSSRMHHHPLMHHHKIQIGDQLVDKDIEYMYLIIWFILLLSFLFKYKTSQSNVFVSRVRNNHYF